MPSDSHHAPQTAWARPCNRPPSPYWRCPSWQDAAKAGRKADSQPELPCNGTKRILCNTTLRYGSVKTSFSIRYRPCNVRVGEFERGNTRLEGNVLKPAMPFFFGEKALAIGDDQSQVASAGLVHARIINFVQNAVAGGEPYPALLIQGGAHAALRARSPTWRNPRPSRSISFGVTH